MVSLDRDAADGAGRLPCTGQDLHVFSLQGRVNAHGLDIGHRFVAHVVDNRPEDVGVDAEGGEIGESGDKTGLVAAILDLGGGGGTRVIPRDDLATD